MTTAQKIIKYLALAFAIILIVSIISGILSGGYAVLKILGIIHVNKSCVTENLNIISNETVEISTLKLDLVCTDLEIKTGDIFKVETNNPKITFTNDNGSVRIEEKDLNWFNNNNIDSHLIIYIPGDMTTLDETKIETGAGKINIEKLNTQGLYLKSGAGETIIEKLNVKDDCKIESGAGKVSILSGNINELNLDIGVGKFEVTSAITGNSKINAGIGNLELNIQGNKENYTIKADKGIGSIKIDGKEMADDATYGDGENSIKIDGGIGSIKIEFEKE